MFLEIHSINQRTNTPAGITQCFNLSRFNFAGIGILCRHNLVLVPIGLREERRFK